LEVITNGFDLLSPCCIGRNASVNDKFFNRLLIFIGNTLLPLVTKIFDTVELLLANPGNVTIDKGVESGIDIVIVHTPSSGTIIE
jgi:hypothetical protein